MIINHLYYPYGKILRSYSNGEVDRYLTTQHERDKETGYDYRGARFYDSDVARFLSLDPKANIYPGVSPYNYVLANPISLTDPDGKCPTCPDGLEITGARFIRNYVTRPISNLVNNLDSRATQEHKNTNTSLLPVGVVLEGTGSNKNDNHAPNSAQNASIITLNVNIDAVKELQTLFGTTTSKDASFKAGTNKEILTKKVETNLKGKSNNNPIKDKSAGKFDNKGASDNTGKFLKSNEESQTQSKSDTSQSFSGLKTYIKKTTTY